MSFFSISRLLSSPNRFKPLNFSLTNTANLTTSSSSEKYWTHLKRNPKNVEKTLPTIGAKLDSSCVNEVLHKCSENQSQLGLRFFIWAGIQSSYRHSSYTYNKACKLFEIERNPHRIRDVIEVYKEQGCLFSVKMFKVVLNLCRDARISDEALWVLRKMEEFGCHPDTTMYNTVIRLFCEMGEIDVAIGLMEEMGLIDLYPNMITYNTMISGFCNVGRLEEACGLIKVMKGHGCLPNVVAYSTLLDGICKFGSVERAVELLGKMEKSCGDSNPNVVTYTSVIQGFVEKGRSTEALGILDRMEDRGCALNRVMVSTLIRGLCVEGFMEEAYKLIDRVVAGSGVSNSECYSSLVISLLRTKKVEEAEKLFGKMLGSGVKPDGLASSLLIKELCLNGRVRDGFIFSEEIEKMGFPPSVDSDVYSMLLVGLCEGSHSNEAAKLARLMVRRGVQLKTPYVKKIVEYMSNCGDHDLVLHLSGIVT